MSKEIEGGSVKEFQNENVLEASLNRIRYIYDSYDRVVVSFSGGKDSTALLNLCIFVAREKNRLPVEAIFFDEEVIHQTTIDYVERVSKLKEVNLTWYCLQIKHRNACSFEEPFWYSWDEEKKDKWVREAPAHGIFEHELFKRGEMQIQDFTDSLFYKEGSKFRIIELIGIRTQESIRRFGMVTNPSNGVINYISQAHRFSRGHPIYDWSSEDVWRLVKLYNLDYNSTYDLLNMTRKFGGKLLGQRVCPPFGEEPLRGLGLYAECFPHMWAKMIKRVDGVESAWRYANTEIYTGNKKPDSLTWREYLIMIISQYSKRPKAKISESINGIIATHKQKTDDPIPDDGVHWFTGCSYKFLCTVALRGDFKGRTKEKMLLAVFKNKDLKSNPNAK